MDNMAEVGKAWGRSRGRRLADHIASTFRKQKNGTGSREIHQEAERKWGWSNKARRPTPSDLLPPVSESFYFFDEKP